MLRDEIFQQVLPAAGDDVDRLAGLVVGRAAREVHRVVLRPLGDVAGKREAGGQGPAADPGLLVDVWDGMQEQVAVSDLDLVALVVEALEVGTKTYQSP